MYLLTKIDGEAYRKLSGLPAIFDTMEAVNETVKLNGLNEWAAVNIDKEEANKLIRNAWYSMNPTPRGMSAGK